MTNDEERGPQSRDKNPETEKSLALIRVIREQIRFLSYLCLFVFIRG